MCFRFQELNPQCRHLGGTASPSGRYRVRSRFRPSDQVLRVLAASGDAVCLSTLCQARENPHLCFLVPGTDLMRMISPSVSGTFDPVHEANHHFISLKWWFVCHLGIKVPSPDEVRPKGTYFLLSSNFPSRKRLALRTSAMASVVGSAHISTMNGPV